MPRSSQPFGYGRSAEFCAWTSGQQFMHTSIVASIWLCTSYDVDSSCEVPWRLCRQTGQVFMGFIHVLNSHVRAAQAPAFNFPDVSRRRFCAEHKLAGMVNLRRAGKRARADAGFLRRVG